MNATLSISIFVSSRVSSLNSAYSIFNHISSPFSSTSFISTHTPHEGATTTGITPNKFDEISTHTPLAGCDLMAAHSGQRSRKFLLTHPSRGATAISCVFTPMHPKISKRRTKILKLTQNAYATLIHFFGEPSYFSQATYGSPHFIQ